MMRTNSIMDDPEPWKEPDLKPPPKPALTDWQKVSKDSKYPKIKKYIEERITFYQRYLPTSQPVEEMTQDHAAENWRNAVIIITELENLESIINSSKPNAKV